jgi:hypothetical protein
MNPERWERIKTLYDQTSALPAAERAAFLARACIGDHQLQARWRISSTSPLVPTPSSVSSVAPRRV